MFRKAKIINSNQKILIKKFLEFIFINFAIKI
jgi:hypothetical protein